MAAEAMSELSLQAVDDAVRTNKRDGTLRDFLFTPPVRSAVRSNTYLSTPLHAACDDRDGQRGEAKIALLLEAARDDGIALDEIAKERRKCSSPWIWVTAQTPLQVLATNSAATERALELVFSAWPGALVETPAGGHETPLELAIRTGASQQRLPSKVATLLRLAESTTIGVSPLLLHRCSSTGGTVLYLAFSKFKLHSMDNVLNVVEQLLQACPALGVVTDLDGNNILHYATSVRDDAIARRLVRLVVDNTPKMYLTAMLSTENECRLRGARSRYGGNLQFSTDVGEYSYRAYEATPVCHIETNGLAQTRELLVNLARETDTNGWTLLHYTAANVLCDGDPQEKQKREAERRTRAAVSRLRVVPPVGPRQGTKKLVEWLLQVHPQACSQRDSSRRFPLHLAVNTGKVWNNGIESLVQGYPPAVAVYDPASGLFPFMTAATQPEADLNTIYSLLRFNPSVVDSLSVAH